MGGEGRRKRREMPQCIRPQRRLCTPGGLNSNNHTTNTEGNVHTEGMMRLQIKAGYIERRGDPAAKAKGTRPRESRSQTAAR